MTAANAAGQCALIVALSSVTTSCSVCDDGQLEKLISRYYWLRAKGVPVPRYSFQVRTGEATFGHGATLEFDSFEQMLAVAAKTMAAQDLQEADLALSLAQSVLEVVDEDGDVVASLPIGRGISRH